MQGIYQPPRPSQKNNPKGARRLFGAAERKALGARLQWYAEGFQKMTGTFLRAVGIFWRSTVLRKSGLLGVRIFEPLKGIPMKQYHDILKRILSEGEAKSDRTGTGTLSVFGHQTRYDLKNSFPLLTTKKVHMKSIIYELLWFLNGDTNTKFLNDHKVTIWDEWADENGDLGPVYGAQWRSWTAADGRTVDQITNLIEQIKTNPYSRRLIVNAWNVGEIEKMALPPCHTMFQFYVSQDQKLSCQLYQRSADVFLGVPFNIASYALLTMMIAQVCGLQPGEFVHTLGDAHLYSNHMEQANLQLSRECKPLPQLKINPNVKSIFDFKFEDFEIVNYDPHPAIKAVVAI